VMKAFPALVKEREILVADKTLPWHTQTQAYTHAYTNTDTQAYNKIHTDRSLRCRCGGILDRVLIGTISPASSVGSPTHADAHARTHAYTHRL
jgi:hypothetical protein